MERKALPLLATVELLEALTEPALPAGARGAIVDVHGGGEAYDVEFVDPAGRTLALVTLRPGQLRPV